MIILSKGVCILDGFCLSEELVRNKYISLCSYLFLILSPILSVSAMDLVIYGGACFSDYAVVSQLPAEIDFNELSAGKLVVLRTGEDLPHNLNLGVECAVQVGSHEWAAESASISRREEVKTGHLEFCLNWYPIEGIVMPFARVGAGVHWGNQTKHYEHGEFVINDNDGLASVPGLSVGGGFRIPFYSSLFFQMEADYSFVNRDSFGGWQVTEADNMNNWKVLVGLGVSL